MIRAGLLALFFAAISLAPVASAEVDPALLAGMQARAIGPAGMSGRIAAVCADPADSKVIYVGAATGGLWKSTDAGLTFVPIFDDQPVASIGAVALDPRNSDVIWVGTGEGNLRNSVSIGNGIYRSRDGGRSWQHLGLEDSERIHRIYVHPFDSDTVYVGVVGKMWGDSEERGVYRTTDGGRSWDRVLYVDERTGCADLEIDPENPEKLIAAMYEYRRDPWFYTSGGPGSGLYISVDGGDTWRKLGAKDGLPAGDLGRIGLAIAPSDPDIVYAYVEAEAENRLYRSVDGGYSWEKTKATELVGSRPFYYADLRVDPERSDRIYSLWSLVSVSDDGGDSFRILMPWQSAHPDHHAMWIHPDDGDFLIEGNDGGVYISRDRGETWRFVGNLPVGQFYHVAVDDEVPYNIYGGMQDNGSWKGPHRVFENGGIRNHDWQEVSFGDGFDTRPMPDDAMRGYSMSQEGYLYRWDRRTGETRSIRPAPPEGVDKLRFNWNAGFAQDPFDPDTIYYGSQFFHGSRDRGLSWEVLSEDLTSNNAEWQKQDESGGLTLDVTGAENFTSIVAIAPSSLEQGVIWVGTDDGRLHLTRDGGATWRSLENKVKHVPEHTWIPHICASPHDAGTAFVVFDNHRRSDISPYVNKVTEYGDRFADLSSDDLWGYALAIEQDLVDPDLLFLGTEFGLYFSVDGGKAWLPWRHGVPTVSVMDLVIQPTQHDLVLGTHGRSFFVLDDIRPLRALDDTVIAKTLHFFEVADAQQYLEGQTGAERFPGATEFRGPNRPYGALLNVWVQGEQLAHPDAEIERARQTPEVEDSDEKDAAPTEVKVEVFAADGGRVRHFDADVKQGLNRIVWDLHSDPFRAAPAADSWWSEGGRGPEVLPGEYRVVVHFGGEEAEQVLRVVEDPRASISMAERRANWDAQQRAGALQEQLSAALHRIEDARADADAVTARIERVRREAEAAGAEWVEDDEKPLQSLADATTELRKGLDGVEKAIRIPSSAKGIQGGITPWGLLGAARNYLESSPGQPSPTVSEHLRRAEVAVSAALETVDAFFAEEIPAYRAKVLEERELELFAPAGSEAGPDR